MSATRRSLIALFATLALFGLLPSPAGAAATYHWISRDGQWTDPASWSPQRTTPQPDDILVFDDGVVGFNGGAGSDLVFGIPNQTIAQLLITNCWVQLTAATGGGTLTITGGTGDDFVIAHQMSVSMAGVDGLVIHLAAGATASLAGALLPAGGPHRVEALSTDAIVVPAIGTVQTGTGFTGNFFGTGSDGFSVLSSVRFQNGSWYIHGAGSNPFAATAPNSVVTFDHGSRFILRSGTPSVSGRTYADFEYDIAGGQTTSGSQLLTVDSLVVDQGTLNLAHSGGSRIKGNIRVMNSAVLTLGPTTGSATHTIAGAYGQQIDDFNPSFGLRQTAGCTLAIDNVDGVACTHTLGIACPLQFVHGILRMPYLVPVKLLSGGSFVGASQSTGWVKGGVRVTAPAGAIPYTFPVGEETRFTPMTVLLRNLVRTVDISAGVFANGAGDAWNAQLDPDHKNNVQYAVFAGSAPLDSTAYTGMQVRMDWQPDDLDPGSDPSRFVARVVTLAPNLDFSPWLPTTLVTQTSSSITASFTKYRNADAWFNFLVGQPATVTVATAGATPAPEGGSAPAGATSVRAAGTLAFHVRLSQPSVHPVSVDYHTVDGTATAGSDYVQTSGTLEFALGDTAKDVLVTLVGDVKPERNESVGLALTNASNATLGDSVATDTILDDDDVTPPTAQVIYPNGGETLTAGTTISLQWQASDDVAVSSVDLMLSRDDGATWEPLVSGIANTGTYHWTPTIPYTTTARLRVIAHDDPGHTGEDLSDAAWTITYPGAGVPEGPVTVFAISAVTPTPTRGDAHIAWAVPVASRVRLQVLDVAGRTVATLVDGVQDPGRHATRWAAGARAPGIYLVRMEAPGFSATRRMVVTR